MHRHLLIEADNELIAGGVSPDGKYLVYMEMIDAAAFDRDIRALPLLDGPRTGLFYALTFNSLNASLTVTRPSKNRNQLKTTDLLSAWVRSSLMTSMFIASKTV